MNQKKENEMNVYMIYFDKKTNHIESITITYEKLCELLKEQGEKENEKM